MADINDIVLIHLEDRPVSFARIEGIEPDVKPGWFRVRLFMLQIPLQSVTWILRDVYINGAEFTMSGKRMRLERVTCPDENALSPDLPKKEDANRDSKTGEARVIDMRSLLKKR